MPNDQEIDLMRVQIEKSLTVATGALATTPDEVARWVSWYVTDVTYLLAENARLRALIPPPAPVLSDLSDRRDCPCGCGALVLDTHTPALEA